MSTSGDPSDGGDGEGEKTLTASGTEGPSDSGDPRHETLLGEDTATDEPMEGVEAGSSTSLGTGQRPASAPQGVKPGPRSDESSPLGELLASQLVMGSSQDEPPELEMILSITASDAEEFLSDGDQATQVVGPKVKSPERPEAGTSVKEGPRQRVRSVVSRVSRRASPTGPTRGQML